MVAVEPFAGQIVRPDRIGQVVSPAHDSMTVDQRRRYRSEHPLSYLHVTRSATDEDEGAPIDSTSLAARGRFELERILAADVFAPPGPPSFLVYELGSGDHVQRGLVCEVAGREFRREARPHEATHADRAHLLVDHALTVRAASSPVACTVADGAALAHALQHAARRPPALVHRSDDGLVQRVWRVDDPADGASLSDALAGQHLYIIDGHHRAEANAQLVERGLEIPLLTTVFPPSSLRLAGFHRLVRLPPGTDDTTFIRQVARRFRVARTDGLEPPVSGAVAVLAGRHWYRVEFDERPVAGGPVVRLGSLDPCIVERELIGAIAARDRPADVVYMPDEDSLDAVVLEARRTGRVPILVAPVTVDDMIEVADGGLTMPPKSTYFTPKVRSGLFLRRYDDLLESR